tara:strand:+ start:31506 stop:32267 length:762 start_codon:yes stop_codon:yes gene_type:complete
MKKYTINEHKKDLNRFNSLNEYDFYVEEEEVYNPELEDDGGEMITEEPPEGEAPEGDEFGSEVPPEGDDMDSEELPDEGGEEFAGAEEMGDEELPEPEPMAEPLPEPEPMEDEVELDVTELVQGTEAAKAASDRATQQIDVLMTKFDTLSQSLEKMSAINQKIDDLEHEIEKRNPLPTEKLEMQSLNSFPYSLKLTDYWSEKEGNYDAMGGNKGNKEDEEYVLTQDEVDRDYNAIEIKDSFVNPEEEEEVKKF